MLISGIDISPKSRLMTLRIIWAALLLGQFFFMVILSVILTQPAPAKPAQKPLDPQAIKMMIIISGCAVVTVIPFFWLVRRMIFARSRVNGLLPPATYATGCVIFWAGCEGVSFFGLVVAMVQRSFWPTILFVAVAMGVQVLSFPRRAAMIPDNVF